MRLPHPQEGDRVRERAGDEAHVRDLNRARGGWRSSPEWRTTSIDTRIKSKDEG